MHPQVIFLEEPVYPHAPGPHSSVHSLLLSCAQNIPPDGDWMPFSGGTARVTMPTVGKSYRTVESSLTRQDGNVNVCPPRMPYSL